MVIAEDLKIFDAQCIRGRIFVSFKKIFDFKYSQTISFTFYVNYIWKKCYKNFFWVIIPFKWHQNTSGCGTEPYNDVVQMTKWF